MRLSRMYKDKLKKRILTGMSSIAMILMLIAGCNIANFSMSVENFLSNKLLKNNEAILVSGEKEEVIEDYSSSSNLNGIYIGESLISGFTSKKLNYEIVFENQLEEIEINVQKQNEGQVVTGIGTISLTGKEQIIEINVTSADGANISTYSLTISYVQEIKLKYEYAFEYTGDYQEFEAPYTGYYKMELWGAQGGSYSGVGGKGAYTSGNVYLKKGQKIYIYVGQTGENLQTATYNGGGAAGTLYNARAGGGATDIRLTSGSWDNFDSLKSRIMVAAGGGGSVGSSYTCNGGAGGTLTGYNGSKGGSGSGYTVAGGATQISGGTPGKGSSTSTAKSSGFGYGGSGHSSHGGGGRRWLLRRRSEVITILLL